MKCSHPLDSVVLQLLRKPNDSLYGLNIPLLESSAQINSSRLHGCTDYRLMINMTCGRSWIALDRIDDKWTPHYVHWQNNEQGRSNPWILLFNTWTQKSNDIELTTVSKKNELNRRWHAFTVGPDCMDSRFVLDILFLNSWRHLTFYCCLFVWDSQIGPDIRCHFVVYRYKDKRHTQRRDDRLGDDARVIKDRWQTRFLSAYTATALGRIGPRGNNIRLAHINLHTFVRFFHPEYTRDRINSNIGDIQLQDLLYGVYVIDHFLIWKWSSNHAFKLVKIGHWTSAPEIQISGRIWRVNDAVVVRPRLQRICQ